MGLKIAWGTAVDWPAVAAGAGISFITAYATIGLFLAFVQRIGMMPFVIYRLLLGAGLILLLAAG